MFLIGLMPPQDPKYVLESLFGTKRPQFYRDPDDILQTHILGGPESSAKFWPNRSRCREMAAIRNRQNQIFALFSQSILVIQTKLGRDIAGGE